MATGWTSTRTQPVQFLLRDILCLCPALAIELTSSLDYRQGLMFLNRIGHSYLYAVSPCACLVNQNTCISYFVFLFEKLAVDGYHLYHASV